MATPGIFRRLPKQLLDPYSPLSIKWRQIPRLAPWLLRFLRAASPSRVEERLDRLESLDAIRQLVAKYCLALDMRDLDALCGLFPEDVRVSRAATGRRALKVWFDQTMREQFTGTAHVTGNHVIEGQKRRSSE